MSTATNAGEIAASFTKYYYTLLTKGNSTAELASLYGENSCVNYIPTPTTTTPEAYQGKAQISAFLAKMQETFGERKVNVRHVDYVAADTNVAITCSGYVYTRMMSRVFSQTFVLAPTKYRTSCFYIVGDSLRFLSEEAETIPAGFVSADAYEALVAARAAEQAKEAEVAAAAAAAAAVAAVATTAPAAAAPAPRERAPRERKPKAEVAAAPAPVPAAATATAAAAPAAVATPAAAATEEPRTRKPLTSFIRIHKVPEEIQLSVVADACAKFGTVADRFWLEEVDCIVCMSKPAEARQIVRLSGRFRIKNGGPFTVDYFYPTA